MTSSYAGLGREELARVVPELLLLGQLMDRAAMPHVIAAWGREEMERVAIEEWQCASPVYTRRMQRALGYEGEDVVTIFKGLQLDIGAPPQFMDFRYAVADPWHGEFWLDHCGALMDVEPMGPHYVRGMCHTIEDPTFDATAIASNAKARVRPLHRPPRVPVDRSPHCHWTVVIDESHPDALAAPGLVEIGGTRAATHPLEAIDPGDPGQGDYAGPLVSDLRFADFSHSALVRMADEVCLQMHLLNLSFLRALRERLPEEEARAMNRRQLTGIAAVASERLCRALGLGDRLEDLVRLLRVHPVLNPVGYVRATVTAGERVSLTLPVSSPANDDRAWPALIDAEHDDPLRSLVGGVDPHFDVESAAGPDGTTYTVVRRDEPRAEPDDVALTRFSSGVTFDFAERTSIPITPV